MAASSIPSVFGDEPEWVRRLAARLRGFDPVALGRLIEERVSRGDERKYFRFRYSRHYGGGAVGDVVGCNLRCAFCWTGRPRDDLRIGEFVSARTAARRLVSIARSRGARVARLSAGEPSLGWSHLLEVMKRVVSSGLFFVLETNGVMIGAEPSRAGELAECCGGEGYMVRVSIKACSGMWFKALTAASEKGLELQLRAVEALYSRGVPLRVAIFAAFGSPRCWGNLLRIVAKLTSETVARDVEVEPLVLYPVTRRRLRAIGAVPTNPELVFNP